MSAFLAFAPVVYVNNVRAHLFVELAQLNLAQVKAKQHELCIFVFEIAKKTIYLTVLPI